MRVGLIAPPWHPVPPRGYGGTEVVIDNLARGLVAAGHEVELFTVGESACPVDKSWAFDEALPGRLNETTAELRHVLAAYEALSGRCDVVHDHTIAGTVAARGLAPMVITNHGPFNDDSNPLFAEASRRAAVVAISANQASHARGFQPSAVIHHGVNPDEFPLGHGDGGYLLFLGRMSPDKGVEQAIRVAREAGARLLIAAKMRETSELAYYSTTIRPLLDDRVRYLGEVGMVEKLDLLGGATALLNPISWPEPFGMVMIEAMACGTPVLATARGAAPEIVSHGRTGYLCDDDAALISAIRRAGELDRAACRAAVEGHFSVVRQVNEHIALYERVANRASSMSSGTVARLKTVPRVLAS